MGIRHGLDSGGFLQCESTGIIVKKLRKQVLKAHLNPQTCTEDANTKPPPCKIQMYRLELIYFRNQTKNGPMH